MSHLRKAIAVFALVTISVTAVSTHAAVHLWQIKEVFTSADGSVQFIEMFDTSPGEYFTEFTTLTANSDGNVKTFDFPSDIPNTKDTFNGHLLIATPGFGALPGGVTPDFTFDQSEVPFTGPFFNPNATNITITFSGSGSSRSFPPSTLPKNGVDSNNFLGMPLGVAVNSPTNIDDAFGSVNLSAPSPTGDYNGDHTVNAADYVLWRNTLTQSVSPNGSGADGSGNGTIDAADYDFWKARFGNAVPGSGSGLGTTAVPEPIAPVCITMGLCLLTRGRRR